MKNNKIIFAFLKISYSAAASFGLVTFFAHLWANIHVIREDGFHFKDNLIASKNHIADYNQTTLQIMMIVFFIFFLVTSFRKKNIFSAWENKNK